MTLENNRRNMKKNKKVFSGLHKPLSDPKLNLKISGRCKHEKFTLEEIRKLVQDTK
jgi:hypothetical protein